MSRSFYETFAKYEFMLIHQTDAFVCTDTLDHFTGLDFDYIGAPWSEPRMCPKWCIKGIRYYNFRKLSTVYDVGNGGLSLRRIERVILALSNNKIYSALARVSGTNEDLFFASLRGYMPGKLRIPSRDVALTFSFDRNPRACFEANGRKLPFGLHNAWGYDPVFFEKEVLPQC